MTRSVLYLRHPAVHVASGRPTVDPTVVVADLNAIPLKHSNEGQGAIAIVVVASTLSGAGQASAFTQPTGWFRPQQSHWAYCNYEAFSRMTCFSTVSGQWITIRRVYKNGKSLNLVSGGTNRKYIGFRRAHTEQPQPLVSDGRPVEYWMLCQTSKTFLKCRAGGRGFWIKKDGILRLSNRIHFPSAPWFG